MNKGEENKIKKCPICGKTSCVCAEEINNPTAWWDSAIRGEFCFCIYCYECGLIVKDEYKEDCIKKWNMIPRSRKKK
ncbi:MAG: hypothetical protein J6U37_01550 [Lachnospiraceae bacterium]|nr:hypothetical protein [Lachnospiraceae bacterium]